MALDFVKNAANYLTYGNGAFNPILDGASKLVISALIFPDTISTTNNVNNSILRVMVDGTSTGIAFNIDAVTSSANGRVRISGRSVTGEAQETRTGTVDIGTGAWKHVGAMMDFGGDTLTTVSNGVVEGSSAVTFNNVTYSPASPTVPDRIGANDDTPPATADQFDGRISELAIWFLDSTDAAFTADEWNALSEGASPLLVRPHLLAFYEPFVHRRTSPQDKIAGLTGTITGTLSYADHPRIYMPRKKALYLASQVFRSVSVATSNAHSAAIQRQGLLNILPKAPRLAAITRLGKLVMGTLRKAVAVATADLPDITAVSAAVQAVMSVAMTLVVSKARSAFSGGAGLGVYIKNKTRWKRRR